MKNTKNIKLFKAEFFAAAFLPLLAKIGGRTANKFSRPQNFSTAGFEFFDRNFGRLATVPATVRQAGTLPQSKSTQGLSCGV